ncbi:MAG: hypothetical protein H8E37_01015, partial [Planctomycetes bacterium]|nr:hypothetical protein [Planctomycetota bacterium]
MTASRFQLPTRPYPGLRPFEYHESTVFFGREQQVDELLGRLRKNSFLAVVGASGCGKSSLIRAGLLPALHRGDLGNRGGTWRIVITQQGTSPIHNLARSLLESGAPADGV